jgi:predicted amidohydrolase YtcJ
LQNITSIDDLIEKGRLELTRLNPEPGAVIHGAGWDQELFSGPEGRRFPNRYDLDKISSGHALILDRSCGHTSSCNSRALELTGLADIPGLVPEGHIEVDSRGKPLGVLHGRAVREIRKFIPPFTARQVKAQLEFGLSYAAANGLTSIGGQDVVNYNWEHILNGYRDILSEKKIRLRIYEQCNLTEDSLIDEFIRRGIKTGKELGHPFLKMGGLKLYADGSLGSHTAWLRKPYSDETKETGFRMLPPKEMIRLVKKADAAGLQVVIHAIGDAAIEEVIGSFETVTGKHNNPLRHGIIHCEVMAPDLLARAARNDIHVLAQPVFLNSDIYHSESRLGRDRVPFLHAFGSMLKSGISVSFGSDMPVETPNPLFGIENAVTRKNCETGEPADGFFPEERIDVSAAVDAYTAGSAFAAFEEKFKGRIKPGFLADFTLLEKDIFTIPPEEIHAAPIRFTMIGGKIGYGA